MSRHLGKLMLLLVHHLIVVLLLGLPPLANGATAKNVSWSVELRGLPEWNTSEIQIPFSVESGTLGVDAQLVDSVEITTFPMQPALSHTVSPYWQLLLAECMNEGGKQLRVTGAVRCSFSDHLQRVCDNNSTVSVPQQSTCVVHDRLLSVVASDRTLLVVIPSSSTNHIVRILYFGYGSKVTSGECNLDSMHFDDVEELLHVVPGFETTADDKKKVYYLFVKVLSQPLIRILRLASLEKPVCSISVQELRFDQYMGSQRQFTFGYSHLLVWKMGGIDEIRLISGVDGTQKDAKVSSLVKWEATDPSILGFCLNEGNIPYSLSTKGTLKCYDGGKTCQKDYRFGIVGLESAIQMSCLQGGGFSVLIEVMLKSTYELRVINCKDPGFGSPAPIRLGKDCFSTLLSTSSSRHTNTKDYNIHHLAPLENQKLAAPSIALTHLVLPSARAAYRLPLSPHVLLSSDSPPSAAPSVTVHLRGTTAAPTQSLTVLPTVRSTRPSSLPVQQLLGATVFVHTHTADAPDHWTVDATLDANLQSAHVLGVRTLGLDPSAADPRLQTLQRWALQDSTHKDYEFPAGWQLIDVHWSDSNISVKLGQNQVTGGYMLQLRWYQKETSSIIGSYDLVSVLLPHSSPRIISAGFTAKNRSAKDSGVQIKDFQVALSASDTYQTFSVYHAVFQLELTSPPSLLSTRSLQRTNIGGSLPASQDMRVWWELDVSPTTQEQQQLLWVHRPNTNSLLLTSYGGVYLHFDGVRAAAGFVIARPPPETLAGTAENTPRLFALMSVQTPDRQPELWVGTVDYRNKDGLGPRLKEDGFNSSRVDRWSIKGLAADGLGNRNWNLAECTSGIGGHWREVVCVLADESTVMIHLQIDFNEKQILVLRKTEFEQVESWVNQRIILVQTPGVNNSQSLADRVTFAGLMQRFEVRNTTTRITTALGYFYSPNNHVENVSKGYLSGLVEVNIPLSRVGISRCYQVPGKGTFADILLVAGLSDMDRRVQIATLRLDSKLFSLTYTSAESELAETGLAHSRLLQSKIPAEATSATVAAMLSSHIRVWLCFGGETTAQVSDLLGPAAASWLDGYLGSRLPRKTSGTAGLLLVGLLLATGAAVGLLLVCLRRRGFRGYRHTPASDKWSTQDDSVTDERSLIPLPQVSEILYQRSEHEKGENQKQKYQ